MLGSPKKNGFPRPTPAKAIFFGNPPCALSHRDEVTVHAICVRLVGCPLLAFQKNLAKRNPYEGSDIFVGAHCRPQTPASVFHSILGLRPSKMFSEGLRPLNPPGVFRRRFAPTVAPFFS